MAVIVMATIVGVVENDNWLYTGCQKCNKAVSPDSNMYYCGGCDTHVINVTPRFLICLGHLVNEYFVQQIYNYKLFTIILQFRFLLNIRVNDDTASATFVMFDQTTSVLLKKSCAEMIEAVNLVKTITFLD